MATFDRDVVADAILETIKSAIDTAGGALRDDYEVHLKAIAGDTADAALRAGLLPEKEVAEVDLRHLEAQVQLVAVAIAIRESARIQAVIKEVILTSVKVLAKVLVTALVA